MNKFESELAAIPNKSFTFGSGSKELMPLIDVMAVTEVRGLLFGLYEALLAANKRCVSLIEGLFSIYLYKFYINLCSGINRGELPFIERGGKGEWVLSFAGYKFDERYKFRLQTVSTK